MVLPVYILVKRGGPNTKVRSLGIFLLRPAFSQTCHTGSRVDPLLELVYILFHPVERLTVAKKHSVFFCGRAVYHQFDPCLAPLGALKSTETRLVEMKPQKKTSLSLKDGKEGRQEEYPTSVPLAMYVPSSALNRCRVHFLSFFSTTFRY